MNLSKSLKHGIYQRFTSNWRKRNLVTDIILYGIQVATILYALVMVVELIDMINDFRDPHPLSHYE